MNTLQGRLFSLVVRLLGVLPLATARSLVGLFAPLTWLARSRAAQTTRTNIDLCFPHLEATQRSVLARQSLKQTASLLAEAGMLFHWPQERWLGSLSVVGAEHIEQPREAGRGVLVLAPHYGNWECLALFLGKYATTALYDPPRIASLETTLRKARERGGVRMLPIDRRGIRAIYEVLVSGRVAALMPDQVPARNAGVYAPFFAQPALTMTFAHRLIQRTKPVVVLGTARRVASGFSIEFSALPQEVYSADPETSAAAMNRAIEDLIRTDPSQYQWEYKRFRRQPPGALDPYGVSPAG